MPADVLNWSLTGADEQLILGNTHLPQSTPRAAAIIVHGFLGYKDYGFIPTLADTLAHHGFAAHRFNLSHSGMTNDTDTFARPDLFARNTWNKQVEDIERVIHALDHKQLIGPGMPVVLIGHSRGGVASLLCAGRRAVAAMKPLDALVTIAAPDSTSRQTDEQRRTLDERGFVEVTSNRTGQTLRIGRAFWEEQEQDPAAHDLLALALKIPSPALVIHGSADQTVDPACAERISSALSHARLALIDGGDHVLNTPNPFPIGAQPSPQLRQALDETVNFLDRTLAAR